MDKMISINQALEILANLQETLETAQNSETDLDEPCINAYDNDKSDELNFSYVG